MNPCQGLPWSDNVQDTADMVVNKSHTHTHPALVDSHSSEGRNNEKQTDMASLRQGRMTGASRLPPQSSSRSGFAYWPLNEVSFAPRSSRLRMLQSSRGPNFDQFIPKTFQAPSWGKRGLSEVRVLSRSDPNDTNENRPSFFNSYKIEFCIIFSENDASQQMQFQLVIKIHAANRASCLSDSV